MLKRGKIKTENSAFIQFEGLDVSSILFKRCPLKPGEPEPMHVAQKSWSHFVSQKQIA